MRRSWNSIAVSTSCLVLLAVGANLPNASGAEPAKMRNIVRKMLPKDVPAVALAYTVLIAKDGEEKPVKPDDYKFDVGDQFLIRIEPKDDMFIYVFTEGPTGEKSCLQPMKEEMPPLAKKDQVIELPGDGYFEFAAPPGEEKLIVVATSEPSKDLAALANVVFRKPDQLLTPKEKEEAKNLKARTEKKLQSTEKEKVAGAKMRGVLSKEKVDTFVKDLKEKKRGTIEEPPHGDETSTFAMAVGSGTAKPELLINISLRSNTKEGEKK